MENWVLRKEGYGVNCMTVKCNVDTEIGEGELIPPPPQKLHPSTPTNPVRRKIPNRSQVIPFIALI